MTMHYGKYVHTDTPITGVFSNNSIGNSIWDAANEGIDPEWQEYLAGCQKDVDDEGITDEEDVRIALEMATDGYSPCTSLIGFKEVHGEYHVDYDAPFSAIVELQGSFNCTQIVHSYWFVRAALCSPCFPGQADGNTPGNYVAFSVPPDFVAEEDTELRSRIFNAETILKA